MSLFQKLITETQISNPPEPAMDHDSLKLMILLPFIAIYFRSFRYETPCKYVATLKLNQKNIYRILPLLYRIAQAINFLVCYSFLSVFVETWVSFHKIFDAYPRQQKS